MELGIDMLGKNRRINCPHALLGGVAKRMEYKPPFTATAVPARSVVAPISGHAIGIDESKLERPLPTKPLTATA